ncbi:MAG: hypothetical protein HYY04_08505 [Chloroflexi bacterium]|nr:hypothetical protein [Chloroflexota bacterium]
MRSDDAKPKNRVLAALRHEETDRVPLDITHGLSTDAEVRLRRHFATDMEGINFALGRDLRWIRPIYLRPPEAPSGANVNWFGGQVEAYLTYADGIGVHPLQNVETVAEVERYPWPSAAWFDYSVLPALAAQYSAYAIVAPADWNPTFSRICELCGIEHAMQLLLWEPAIVEAMVAHISEFQMEYARRTLDAAPGLIDIMFNGDDVAGQNGLLFRPDLWRRYFKPSLARLFSVGKERGLHVMFHSCGAVREIIPDLLDIGLDVLNPTQVGAAGMDPEKLKAEFGHRLSFHGGVDTQYTLPFGATEEVRAEVRERIDVLGRKGGYILGAAHTILDEVPTANVLAMYDEARRYRPGSRQQGQHGPGGRTTEPLPTRGRRAHDGG